MFDQFFYRKLQQVLDMLTFGVFDLLLATNALRFSHGHAATEVLVIGPDVA